MRSGCQVLGPARRVAGAFVLGVCLTLVPASVARAHGEFDKRLERANREVAEAPESAAPLLRRSQLYRRQGEFAAARADLDRAERLSPGRSEVAYYRALLLLDEGQPGEALALLDGLLGAEPERVDAHIARARALRALDRPAEAAAAYGDAIEWARVAAPDPYLERARALAMAGPEQLDTAIAALDAGIEALGPLPALTRAAVDLEVQAARFDAALGRLEREIARSPQPAWWLARKGEILDASGRRAEARHAYLQALGLVAAQPAHRRGSAAWRELEGRLTRALSRVDSGHPEERERGSQG